MWTLRSHTLVGEETGGVDDTSFGIEEIADGCEWEGGGVNMAWKIEADKRRRGGKAKSNLAKEENGRMEKEVKEEEVHEENCEDGNATKSRGRSHERWRRLSVQLKTAGALAAMLPVKRDTADIASTTVFVCLGDQCSCHCRGLWEFAPRREGTKAEGTCRLGWKCTQMTRCIAWSQRTKSTYDRAATVCEGNTDLMEAFTYRTNMLNALSEVVTHAASSNIQRSVASASTVYVRVLLEHQQKQLLHVVSTLDHYGNPRHSQAAAAPCALFSTQQ
ncbi:hypothetical protein EmuJ_000278700 [Echinococcus multilocularis]|uniref:Uncharacterized protein n=1 Tax=Echinococcus multilocularis TaxID=6211 RepID=A0A068XUQ4_ECHMU|nr:hypothetical protein EmuJ_000278700 [Echinococcus multilocularis]